jgi:hypothetical protein
MTDEKRTAVRIPINVRPETLTDDELGEAAIDAARGQRVHETAALNDYVAAGFYLVEFKSRIAYGDWTDWIEREWTPRTGFGLRAAQERMRVARNWLDEIGPRRPRNVNEARSVGRNVDPDQDDDDWEDDEDEVDVPPPSNPSRSPTCSAQRPGPNSTPVRGGGPRTAGIGASNSASVPPTPPGPPVSPTTLE